LVFINAEIAVETWFQIAFANDKEEPAKGRQGRDQRCRVVPSGMGVRSPLSRLRASRPCCRRAGSFSKLAVRVCMGKCMSRVPIATNKIQREDS
jgi:hypothetical protein